MESVKGELIETNIRVVVTRDQRLGENGEMLDKEAWHAEIHGVAKSRTRLSN